MREIGTSKTSKCVLGLSVSHAMYIVYSRWKDGREKIASAGGDLGEGGADEWWRKKTGRGQHQRAVHARTGRLRGAPDTVR